MAISKKSKLSSLFASGLTSCCSLLVMAPLSMAFAEEDEAVVDEEIVAVGSQIRGASIEGTLPVTSLNAEDIGITGATTGDELLRSIPQVGSIGFGDSRGGITGVNAARGDVGSVNLRSLGEGNTLVLVNGRRMVLHPITQTSSIDGVPIASVNSNTLPVAGIQRVEVLRDGAGALYGSDAVAGVLNYVLQKDYEGSEIKIRVGAENGTSRDDFSVGGAKGFVFNDGATNLLVSGEYTKKNGLLATEKSFSSRQDLRPRAPEEFRGDVSLDQRSSLEVFPELSYSGLGTFHLRPANLIPDGGGLDDLLGVDACGSADLAGALTVINDGTQDLCLDAGSANRALRPDRNFDRSLSPDIERINIFSYLTHELEGGGELYGELAYYDATANRQWEQASILSNGRFVVPAEYYWNPLGPVTFADGRTNPNRLAGLDPTVVPEEGLEFTLRSLRPVDVGPRQVEVNSTSYRFLAGYKGTFADNWDYDTAVLYSKAETDDVASNRISTPLLQQQLSLDTADAYNIFTGVNPEDPSSIDDQTVNPRSSIDPFIVSATRSAETTLKMVDFKLSNGSLFSLPAGDVGVGVGLEWREETLDEDNSDIFDGSQPYRDPLSSDPDLIRNLSSLQGSSVRPDVSADRTVSSAYAEFLVPLVADAPGAQSIDMQLAVRYEDFSDVGSITRPKVALSWRPFDQLLVRGAFSKGFRAPNLIQLNSPPTSITTAVDDYAEGLVLGNGTIDDGPANGNYILETSGNTALEPEESDSVSFGVVITPTENVTITADWWEVETTGTVGVFTDENESRLDAVLRASGSSNPNVIRDTPDAENPLGEILRITRRFENLNTRTVSGYDLEFLYNLDTSIGAFKAKFAAARVANFDQEAGGNAQLLVDFGANPSVLGSTVGSLIEREFIPKWRSSASINWNSNDDLWGAGLFASYVGEVFEPSVTNSNGDFFIVESYTTVNLSLTRRDIWGENSSVRLGINNAFNNEPPLASEAFGFEGELHSSLGRYVSLTLSKSFN